MSNKPDIWWSIPGTHGRVQITLKKDASTAQEEAPLEANPLRQTLETDNQETWVKIWIKQECSAGTADPAILVLNVNGNLVADFRFRISQEITEYRLPRYLG